MYEFETIFVHIFLYKSRESSGRQGIPRMLILVKVDIVIQCATGILQNTCLQQGILTIYLIHKSLAMQVATTNAS